MNKPTCVLRVATMITVLVLFATTSAFASVQLTFWHSLGGLPGQVLEELVTEFNDSQSEIAVDAQYMGNHSEIVQKLLASIAGRSTPHIATLGQRQGIPQIYDSGALLTADELIARYGGLERADLLEGFVTKFTYRDQLVALPFANSTPVIHYNKDLFREAGLDPERGPETWDELVEYAKKLTKDTNGDGRIDQWGLNTGGDTPWYIYALITQNNGQVLDGDWEPQFNDKQAVEVFQLWSDLVHKHKVMPDLMHAHMAQDFVMGKLGMGLSSIGSTANFANQIGESFDYGVAFLPGNLQRAVPVGGAGIGVFKSNAEEEEATWEFTQWLLSPDIMAKWAMDTGYVPVTHSATNSEALQTYIADDARAGVGITQLEYLKSEGVNPADFEIWSGITKLLEQIESNPRADIQRLLDDLAEQIRTYIRQYN